MGTEIEGDETVQSKRAARGIIRATRIAELEEVFVGGCQGYSQDGGKARQKVKELGRRNALFVRVKREKAVVVQGEGKETVHI